MNQLGHDVYDWVPSGSIKLLQTLLLTHKDLAPIKMQSPVHSCPCLVRIANIYIFSAQDSIEQMLVNLLALSRSFYQMILIGFPEFGEFMLFLLYASSS